MLLVIDVGNTNFVLGLYKKEKLVGGDNDRADAKAENVC